jgi:hypothetical protein
MAADGFCEGSLSTEQAVTSTSAMRILANMNNSLTEGDVIDHAHWAWLEEGPAGALERPTSGPGLHRFVQHELRAFLRCGVLAYGFLRLHCDDCGHDRRVAFSCYLELKTIRSPREEPGVEKSEG